MDRREVKQRFSIRKYKLGAASVLLATVFAGGLATSNSVSADEVEGAGAESQEAPSQEQPTMIQTETPVTYGGEVILEQPSVSEQKESIKEQGVESKGSAAGSETVTSEGQVEASSLSTAESQTSANSAFRATVAPRAAVKTETQIYSQSQMMQEKTKDTRDTGASANGLKGYMQPEGRTQDRELVRWELTYTPTRVNGNSSTAPVGVQIALASNLSIVPGSVKFNNQTLSGSGEDYSSTSVKANINQANRITFQTYVDRKSITYSHVTVRMATDLRPNTTSTVRASATPVAEPNNRNIVWVTAKFDQKVYEETVKEWEAPEETRKTESIPFETSYQADEQMEVNQTQVVQEGKNGEKTIVTTYSRDDQGNTVENTTETVTTAPVNRIVKVGTKPKVEEKTLDYEVRYRGSEERPLGWESIANAGVKGLEKTTTTYTLNPATGEVTANEPTTELVRRVINRVFTIGAMPTVVTSELSFETEYIDDPNMKAGDPEVEVTAGQNGQKTVTTTYKVDELTGKVTPNQPTEEIVAAVNRVVRRGVGQESKIPYTTTYVANDQLEAGQQVVVTEGVEGIRQPDGTVSQEVVNKLVQVGTKPKVEVTELAYETEYQDDPRMKPTDPEVVVVEGQTGQKTVTTTYSLNTTDGTVSANQPTEEIVAAVNRVVRRGVGHDTPIPFTTRYVANNMVKAYETKVLTPGQDGLKGPDGSIIREAVEEIIEIGTMTEYKGYSEPAKIVYIDDPKMLPTDPEIVEQEGEPTYFSTAIHYTLVDASKGTLVGEPSDSMSQPVPRVIRRGVGAVTKIPYRTVFSENKDLEASETKMLVSGVDGIQHPNGSVIQNPVDEIVQVGVKPHVVTENLSFQTIYQEDPSMLASDSEVVVQAGQTGQRVSTTSYSLDQVTGQVTALPPVVVETAAVDQIIKRGTGQNTELPFETHYVADATLAAGEKDVRIQGQTGIRHPNGSITKEVVAQVVAVGTRPSQRTETVAFTTRYLEAKEMAANSRRTLVKGQTGQKTFTVTYVLDTANGQVTAQPETEALTIQPVTEVIEVGTKSTMRTVDLEFSTVYKEDKEMTAGQQVVDQEGQKGLDTYTTTYVLNVETGQVTAQPEVVERTNNPVARVVRVGVKPLIVETELGFETVYQDDPMMLPTDKEVVLVEGQVGKETRTTNYVLDIQTGQVTAQEPIVERQDAINRLVKRGVGHTSPIAFKVIYKGDVTLTAGQRVVDQEGQEGLRHPNGSVLKEALDQIIRVGLKPVEKVEELPFEEEVIEDPNLPLGQICVEVEGQAGKRITRITYSLNPETGEVTAHESVETLAPVKRIVRKGTKVEEVCPPAEVEVSTPAPEAKVLPNTGTADSAALLVAGGLAGLAGLGLAAKKREED